MSHLRRLTTAAVIAALPLVAPLSRGDGEEDAKPVAADASAVKTKLVMSTWAPTGFLKNPTSLSFDRAGRCYVGQTQRREGGEMTNRANPKDLLLPDLGFTTVEDRARFGGKGDAAWGEQTGGKQETITLLEDTKHAGVADRANVFYQGWDRNVNDILAGVMWWEGNVYATVAPDLWMLRDTKGTGQADDVRSISHGYAVHMGYPGHNMHGLTVGPDGKIYWTLGDKGANVALPDGRRLDYHNTGVVMRANPDGSDPEVYAYGLRNCFEVAFDKYGNLFAVDNDGDYPKEKERVVYITEGSDTGWRFHWQFRSAKFDVLAGEEGPKNRYNVWMDERMSVPYWPGQAAHITPALANYLDGPAGFKYASEGTLDERYAGHFFVTLFPKAQMNAFALKPKGAYFTVADDHVVAKGTQCIGISIGPDGALYGAEWGLGGYKLAHTGSVVKWDDPEAAKSALRVETAKLYAEGPYQRTDEELLKLLGHADMRVRLDAQFELVRRNKYAGLAQVAFGEGSAQMARVHAMWGLGQFNDMRGRPEGELRTLAPLGDLLRNPDAEVRAQAVKLLGEVARKHAPITPTATLLPLLKDESARVRFFAGIAIGKYKDPAAAPALLELLAASDKPVDPYLRHAAAMGLVGSNNADALVGAALHPSQNVRLGAIVALRRLRSPGVAKFLADRDEVVLAEAARAIHDDESIPEALPALAAVATRPQLKNEALLRRALNANFRLGDPAGAGRLIEFAAADHNPPHLRVEALDMLANWESPHPIDRVEGAYRPLPPRDAAPVRAALAPVLANLLAGKNADVARAATRMVGALKLKTDDSTFAAWVTDANQAPASRVTALRLLAGRKYERLGAMVDAALASDAPMLRAEALQVLAKTDARRAVAEVKKALDGPGVLEKQAGYRILATLEQPEAEAMLAGAMNALIADTLAPEVRLDVLEAAQARKRSQALVPLVKTYTKALDKSDPLAPYYLAMRGGDADRGRDIFNGHPEAACARCHSAGEVGAQVGPNLAGIGSNPDKHRAYLLESMIEPNAYVVPGYGISNVKLKNGDELSGFIKSEDPTSVQVLDLENNPVTVKKADIESRTEAVSMMPAMGSVLSKSEIRDVIEYLESLKK